MIENDNHQVVLFLCEILATFAESHLKQIAHNLVQLTNDIED